MTDLLRMELEGDPKERRTSHITVYLAWCNDLLLDVFADAASADKAIADYREDHPGDWHQTSTGRWCEFQAGNCWRLVVEARPVIAALPIIHVDGATRATEEAL